LSDLYTKLHQAATKRRAGLEEELNDMEALAGLYEGELPEEYAHFFPQNTPTHVVNYIRLAWDDLAQSIARTPEVQADPKNSSDLQLRKASKLEKIVQGYFQNARPSEGMFLFQNAWNLVGLGRFAAVVVPDLDNQAPRFEARDPRNALPGAKRKVGHIVDELSDIIFIHELKYDEAVERNLAPRDMEAPPSTVKVYEYIDDTMWAVVSAHGQQIARHDLGTIPVVYGQMFSPNKGGMSQFSEQISLMVAVSRIITQKMAYLDRVIYPVTWVKGLEKEITLGPNAVNVLTQQGEIGQLSPPAQLQVDRDLANLERYQRILNRNPEVRQGEVDGKGAYVGARTLDALDDAVDNSVSRYWDVMQAAYQKLAAVALCMDEKLFNTKDKTISVVMKGQRHVETYTPSEDIDGRREVRVAYGFGVGTSYQAFLENVQGFQSGLVPKKRAVAAMPGGQDANQIMRELELDKIDEVAFAGFLAQAQQGGIDMGLWAKYSKKMEDDGLSWKEAFMEYQEEFERQAAQSAQQPIPDTALTQAPEMPVEQEQALPSAPPPGLLGV
jgi:hypothetical protein